MMQVGAQLFTLRDYTQTAKDLDFSLGQVAQMGYRTAFCRACASCATSTA